MSSNAAEQACAYLVEGKRVLGTVRTAAHIVAERFFDEAGGTQLVVHAPFGARINKAWGLSLRNRLSQTFGSDLQASATDDGINLSLGPGHSFPLSDFLLLLRSQNVDEALLHAVLSSPVFVTRWRWTVTRSLALLRFAGGRRVPHPIQRMRSDDLLALLFPEQSRLLEGGMFPGVPVPDHPLVFETLRDCFHEAMDLEGLRQVLRKIECGEIAFSGKDTPMPSVFAHQILNAMPYAFLDDAPLEERRARAVILRRALPENADDLGVLNPEAIRSASEDAWPVVRDAEELHDALLGLVLFPEGEVGRFPREASDWMDSLVRDGRLSVWRQMPAYIGLVREQGDWDHAGGKLELNAVPAVSLRLRTVRGWMEASGPFRRPRGWPGRWVSRLRIRPPHWFNWNATARSCEGSFRASKRSSAIAAS